MTARTTTLVALLLAGTATPLAAQSAPIVIPGAPGQASRTVSAAEAIKLSDTRYSPADVMFMQLMIVHHQQALDMTKLVKARTNNAAILKIADRIEASQKDEMTFMTDWLKERGEPAEMAGMGHAHHQMQGMASPDQMRVLAAANGTAFDSQFLSLMTAHHRGAVDMVDELHKTPGTAYEPVLYEFTNEIVSDQNSEIDRMNAVAATLSTDPRATLAAGFRDAGQAISNMRLVTAMAKPAGFFDPANPAQLAPAKPKKDGDKPKPLKKGEEPPKPQFGERGSLLSFANTDIAFAGDMMVAGSYHGFNTYRLGADGVPALVSSTVCPGGQGDVSIVGKLLVMSVEDRRARKDCGLGGVNETVSDERFRGLRIFDVSDWRAPRQVGQVQTCRGSHTHSIVSADDRRIVVYNSGTSSVRDEKELAGCLNTAGDNTALFSIDVVEIPIDNPASARIVDRPRIFARDGEIAGLWRGGDHGDGTQDTSITNQCHDITVFPALKLAAGACSGNGIILDISEPLKPKRIDDVTDKGFAYWHSATFNNDGTKVLFTDEWGGGGRPRCQAGDPASWGANAFYTIENRKLVAKGTYKLPAPQSDKENCVAHNGSIVPVPGRDIFVQAWYQGGISVIDFTDPAKPFEIAYFDRGPIDKDQLVTGGYWSAYWYKGRIYATEISRGIDVFALEPSEFLTAEEIAAAEGAIYPGDVFNPQTQTQVTWPRELAAAAEASRKGG
jgi:uncharacterized protein (DUF305 family)